MARKKTAGGTPAVKALEKAGATFTLHEYEFVAQPGRIGLAAAEALGVAPERVLKTLMVLLDEREMVIAILQVDQEIDLKALARAAGGKRAAMADVAAAERATGYVKGGISPFGQRQRHRCLVDEAAMRHATVIVNGGRRGLQVELAPAALVELTGAAVAALGRG